MMRQQPQNQQDYYTKVFYELSALVLNIMRSPPPPSTTMGFSDGMSENVGRRRVVEVGPAFQQITPAGFASLLLGISLSLMLCGSVTFFLGFMLMPWILGLVVFLYFLGIVSSISMIGKAILCYNSSPPSPRKDVAREGSAAVLLFGSVLLDSTFTASFVDIRSLSGYFDELVDSGIIRFVS